MVGVANFQQIARHVPHCRPKTEQKSAPNVMRGGLETAKRKCHDHRGAKGEGGGGATKKAVTTTTTNNN